MKWHERLNLETEKLGWSSAELAKRSGVPYDSILKYRNGIVENPRGSVLKKLAKAINANEEWLRFGDQETSAPTDTTKGEREETVVFPIDLVNNEQLVSVPLITLRQFYMDTTQGTSYAVDADSYTIVSKSTELSGSLVSVGVVDDSMYSEDVNSKKSLSINDKVVVDLKAKVLPGDLVMALVEAHEQVIIRKYKAKSIDPNGFAVIELTPFNDSFPPIVVEGYINDIIKGKVVQRITSF